MQSKEKYAFIECSEAIFRLITLSILSLLFVLLVSSLHWSLKKVKKFRTVAATRNAVERWTCLKESPGQSPKTAEWRSCTPALVQSNSVDCHHYCCFSTRLIASALMSTSLRLLFCHRRHLHLFSAFHVLLFLHTGIVGKLLAMRILDIRHVFKWVGLERIDKLIKETHLRVSTSVCFSFCYLLSKCSHWCE